MSMGGLGMKIRAANAFVTLGVQDNLSQGLSKAERKLKDFGQRMGSMASKLAGASLAIAGPGLFSSKTFAGFESTMASVRGRIRPTATEFQGLWDLAKKLGAETQFTARDAAQAMDIFAQRGKSVADIMTAMLPTLDLAAAGNLSVAEAADLATKIMNTMGLPAAEITRATDVLAKAASTAATDVHELGEAFKHVGPAAKLAGMTLEDTVAYMQLMSDASVTGEMAGTNLRGAMLALTSPSEKAAQVLKDLKVKIADANDNMLPLYEIVRQFNAEFDRRGFGSNTRLKMLGDIFDARQASGFAAAVAKGGDAMVRMADSLRDAPAEAFARNLAAIKMNTLAGQWELFTSALETLWITIGEIISKPLRSLLRGVTGLVAEMIHFVDTNQWVIVALGVIGGLLVSGAAYFLTLSLAAMYASTVVQLFGFSLAAARVSVIAVNVSMTVLTLSSRALNLTIKATGFTFLALRNAVVAATGALVAAGVAAKILRAIMYVVNGTTTLLSAAITGLRAGLIALRSYTLATSTALTTLTGSAVAARGGIQAIRVLLTGTKQGIAALFGVLISTKNALLSLQLALFSTQKAFQVVYIVTVTTRTAVMTYKVTLVSLTQASLAFAIMSKLLAGYLFALRAAFFAARVGVAAQAAAMAALGFVTRAYQATAAFVASTLAVLRIASIGSAVATWLMTTATVMASFAMRTFQLLLVGVRYAAIGASLAVRGLGIAVGLLGSPWVSLAAVVTGAVLLVQNYLTGWSVTLRDTGGQFEKLWLHVKWTMQGIYDAIVAGKIGLAFEIAMAGAKLALTEGLLAVSAMFGMTVEDLSKMLAELYKQFMQVVTKMNTIRAEASNWLAKQMGNLVGVDVTDGDNAALSAAYEWQNAINSIDTSKLANSISDALNPEEQMQALNDLLAEAALAADSAYGDPKFPGGPATPKPDDPIFGGDFGTGEAAKFASIGSFSTNLLSRQLPGAKSHSQQIATNTQQTVKELVKIGATLGGMPMGGLAFGP